MKTAIHWFRRDFRLTDNTALNAAARPPTTSSPFTFSATGSSITTGPARTVRNSSAPACACSPKNLEADRRAAHHPPGPGRRELDKLAAETGAEAIFFNRDPDPFGRTVEGSVEAMAKRLGIAVSAHKDIALHERDDLRSGSGNPTAPTRRTSRRGQTAQTCRGSAPAQAAYRRTQSAPAAAHPRPLEDQERRTRN